MNVLKDVIGCKDFNLFICYWMRNTNAPRMGLAPSTCAAAAGKQVDKENVVFDIQLTTQVAI